MLAILMTGSIPIVGAIFVLLYLHRRHMNKLKQEDATDKTKSMDFGMGGPRVSKMNHLTVEKTSDSRSRRQMSLDMDAVAAPYLMPTRGSQESMRSMARTVNSVDDRYGRPAPSILSPTRQRDDYFNPVDSPNGSEVNIGLLGGAQRKSAAVRHTRSQALAVVHGRGRLGRFNRSVDGGVGESKLNRIVAILAGLVRDWSGRLFG